MEANPLFLDLKNQYVKMVTLFKSIYRWNSVPIKILFSFSTFLKTQTKKTLKFIWSNKYFQTAKLFYTHTQKDRRLLFPCFHSFLNFNFQATIGCTQDLLFHCSWITLHGIKIHADDNKAVFKASALYILVSLSFSSLSSQFFNSLISYRNKNVVLE